MYLNFCGNPDRCILARTLLLTNTNYGHMHSCKRSLVLFRIITLNLWPSLYTIIFLPQSVLSIVVAPPKVPLFMSSYRWIREMEGTRLRIVTASDPNYMRTLEAAVRVGEPMLLKVGLLYCMCVC